ncbi:hypothetical protein B0A48_05452 [Cryoendolithus antarcticus]|uniref:F-box domain-containing protein n=1 Tax=Cryoendolithus antarcticus TaxID=1507870 RepID=A0A1V8TIL1_9PEZI|nr:hypothetical protein B0A48_05452 [Cryoendolithus antarcticus]
MTVLSLGNLPDELTLQILCFLDIPELLALSRTSRSLRLLSLDPHLHALRLKYSLSSLAHLLPLRPPLQTLQPPTSNIYLSRTHLAARRLHWSLVCIRLSRSLQRRPKLSSLVAANILPKECCRVDRRSGDFVWGGGGLVERKRQLERERLKEGLRVWLERKAREIRARRKDGSAGVGVLVWKFSKKMKVSGGSERREIAEWERRPKREKVGGLKRFWEGLGSTGAASG